MIRVPELESARLKGEGPDAPVPEVLPLERLWDAYEAAAFVNVPVSWIREETRQGRFPHVKLGRYRRYVPADVIAWVERQKSGRAA